METFRAGPATVTAPTALKSIAAVACSMQHLRKMERTCKNDVDVVVERFSLARAACLRPNLSPEADDECHAYAELRRPQRPPCALCRTDATPRHDRCATEVRARTSFRRENQVSILNTDPCQVIVTVRHAVADDEIELARKELAFQLWSMPHSALVTSLLLRASLAATLICACTATEATPALQVPTAPLKKANEESASEPAIAQLVAELPPPERKSREEVASTTERLADLRHAVNVVEEQALPPRVFHLASAPLPAGAADPDCLKYTEGVRGDIARALAGDVGDSAIYLQHTGAMLVVGLASTGNADSLPWKSENGPLCRSIKQEYASHDSHLFLGLTPQTCNEYLAAMRALTCLEQVQKELASSIRALQYAKIPLILRRSARFETCSYVDERCRSARVVVEIGVEFEDSPEREQRPRLTPV